MSCALLRTGAVRTGIVRNAALPCPASPKPHPACMPTLLPSIISLPLPPHKINLGLRMLLFRLLAGHPSRSTRVTRTPTGQWSGARCAGDIQPVCSERLARGYVHVLTQQQPGVLTSMPSMRCTSCQCGLPAANTLSSSLPCPCSQDFVADHSDPNIDFTAIHIWPGERRTMQRPLTYSSQNHLCKPKCAMARTQPLQPQLQPLNLPPCRCACTREQHALVDFSPHSVPYSLQICGSASPAPPPCRSSLCSVSSSSTPRVSSWRCMLAADHLLRWHSQRGLYEAHGLWSTGTPSNSLFITSPLLCPLTDSQALGKPMIVEEFGAQTNRDPVFK